jgi:hypothetical protein
MVSYIKDPDAKLDYGFNWTDWLADGETISSSAWTIPTGLTEVSESNTSVLTTVWVSGGTHGTDYELVNRIVTSAGRQEDRTIKLKVRNR